MPFYFKKKKLGVVAHFRSRYAKTICVKMSARKNNNRPVSGFFTKIAYFQVMNFIPVKVSTLYIFSSSVSQRAFCDTENSFTSFLVIIECGVGIDRMSLCHETQASGVIHPSE
jgi:hypothetical protein